MGLTSDRLQRAQEATKDALANTKDALANSKTSEWARNNLARDSLTLAKEIAELENAVVAEDPEVEASQWRYSRSYPHGPHRHPRRHYRHGYGYALKADEMSVVD